MRRLPCGNRQLPCHDRRNKESARRLTLTDGDKRLVSKLLYPAYQPIERMCVEENTRQELPGLTFFGPLGKSLFGDRF